MIWCVVDAAWTAWREMTGQGHEGSAVSGETARPVGSFCSFTKCGLGDCVRGEGPGAGSGQPSCPCRFLRDSVRQARCHVLRRHVLNPTSGSPWELSSRTGPMKVTDFQRVQLFLVARIGGMTSKLFTCKNLKQEFSPL